MTTSRNKLIAVTAAVAAVFMAPVIAYNCFERIATGEVGIRVNASKEIQGTELMPGSWNQTIIGSVLTFPTKDIAINVVDKNYITADSSALKDFDVTVVYAINPTSVSEIYSTKSKSFHSVAPDGDILLMYSYVETLVNNAAQKAVRQYKALDVTDKRAEMESSIVTDVNEKLKAEKLDNSITLTAVQIKSILPNESILKSASDYVAAQNNLRVKETEVEIAKKEAERMQALAFNAEKSIAYMRAQAELNISEGVKNGKVNTVIIPSNLTMLGNTK